MGRFVNNHGRGNQTKMEFSFQDLDLSDNQRAERKMFSRIAKNGRRKHWRIEDNREALTELVGSFSEDETLHVFSDSIDSPNIINTFINQIEEAYVSTWSITPAGVGCLENLASNGCFYRAVLMLDRTHSYKWIFKTGAYSALKGKVEIRIATNHAKFIVFKLKDGKYLNFIGSMNLSNNPRWENMLITKSEEDFIFYRDCMLSVPAEILE